MKKKVLKLSALAFLFMLLAGATSAFASSDFYKIFTFNFAYGVVGSTKFELGNESTTMSGYANTYKYELDENDDYILVSDSKEYKFTLNPNSWLDNSYTTDWFPADGIQHKHTFSTVEEKTYTVDVDCKEKLGSMNRRIIGNGIVQQPKVE